MELTPDPRNACFSKKAYPGESVATAVARNVWRSSGLRLRSYACELCGAWHLTKSNAPVVMRDDWRPPEIGARERADLRKREQRRRRRG